MINTMLTTTSTTMLRTLSLAAVVVALSASTSAFAAKSKPAGNDDVLDKPTSDAPAKSDDDKPADDTGTKPDAPEKSKTAPSEEGKAPATGPVEETIFVVEGKPYLSQGKFELTPQIAQSVNDSFTSHTGVLLSGLYHLKENVAFEVSAGTFAWVDEGGPHFGGRDTALTVELRQKEALAPERVKLYQFPWLVGADAQWSPFYGKVSLMDVALGQFDLYVSVGAAAFGLQLETVTAPPPGQKTYVKLAPTFGVLPTMAASTTVGGGLRFYFTDWLGVRLEVRDYVIPLAVHDNGADAVSDADGPSFDVTNLVLAQLGVTFVF